MISLDSLRPEFIDKMAKRLKIVDKAVLERAIHAFVLLDRLAGTKAEFTFKGGTSLLLQLKEPRRLSVDIDTFCVMPADEFRSILEKEVCRNPPFFRMEEDLRGAYDQPQRRHYKLYYKTAYNKMQRRHQRIRFHVPGRTSICGEGGFRCGTDSCRAFRSNP